MTRALAVAGRNIKTVAGGQTDRKPFSIALFLFDKESYDCSPHFKYGGQFSRYSSFSLIP